MCVPAVRLLNQAVNIISYFKYISEWASGRGWECVCSGDVHHLLSQTFKLKMRSGRCAREGEGGEERKRNGVTQFMGAFFRLAYLTGLLFMNSIK